MGFSNPIVGAGNALVRPAIKSPNYSPGVAGWSINRTGDAEFNDLVVRGVFHGAQYVINDSGTFFYNPSPGAGNLVGSWAAADGVDQYGNTYFAGLVSYNGPSSDNEYAQVYNGSLAVGVGEDPVTPFGPHPGLVATLGDNSAMALLSPHTTALPTQIEVDLCAAPVGAVSGQQTYQRMAVNNGDVWVNGIVRRARFVGFNLVAETPQTPTYTANFAAGSTFGTFTGLEFWADAEDNLRIVGAFHALAAVSSAAVFTLPTGYLPAGSPPGMFVVPVGTLTSAGAAINSARVLQVQSNGVVTMKSPAAVTIGDNFYVDASLPLGHLA